MDTAVTIRILGKDYNVRGDGSEEHILRVAQYLNNTMLRLKTGNNTLDSVQLGVLAGLTIAEEYLETKQELESTKKELERMRHPNYQSRFRR